MPRHLTITFLDVGQGDAMLVEQPATANQRATRWLVDAGPSPSAVSSWLRRRHIRHLDAIIATHDERDHTGGIPGVLASGISVGALWAMEPSDELREAAHAAGVPVTAPARRLWPPPGPHSLGRNDRSIVVDVGPVLFTGDVEQRAEQVLAQTLQRSYPILKVPHHGSASSSTHALLQVVKPELAIVSVGAHNRYGHPHPTVLERLADTGATVLRTDLHGTIVVQVSEHGTWDVQVNRPWRP